MIVELDVKGPYSLAESRAFLEGFTPAGGGAASIHDALALAFRLDGTFEPIGVLVRQIDGATSCDVLSNDPIVSMRAAHQAARMLGLDVDATAWADIGARDATLGRVLALHPGWRAVAFPSPWEAGVWGLLAHRINMKQAAAIKRRVGEEHGDVVKVGDKSIPLFPSPAQVLALPKAPKGIPDEKWARIAGLAQAARAGKLESDRLRQLGEEAAMAELGSLRGVGAWTAAHIHLRGTPMVDVVSLAEPRVIRAVQHAYAMTKEPSADELRALADRWKPYRTWAMVLLALHLNRTGKWNDAGDAQKRGRGRHRAR